MAKKSKIAKQEELKVKLDRWWRNDRDARKKSDWQWFVNDLWVAGYHYTRWDRDTQTIQTDNRDKGRPKVVVNKIYPTLRAVRNFITRNQPKAVVTPEDMTDENVEDVRKQTLYLGFLEQKLRLDLKLKAALWSALKNSVGYWQVLWDEDADDGNGEVDVNFIDEYDLYWDSVARFPEEARRVHLAVRRPLEELENDSKYDSKAVRRLKEDKQLSSSSLKTRFMGIQKGAGNTSEVDPKGTIIVRETWWKEEQQDSSPKIMVAAMAGNQLIRPAEETDLTRFPFFRLQADVNPLSMYGQGWVKNLIPVNRQLNRLESQVAEYNDLMNRGKWITDKGAGVRVINNESGQIISKKRGYEVKQGAIAPMANSIFNQIQNMVSYLEDIGGIHEATLGRVPTGVKSGEGIEALQQGDANSISEIVENTENFLEDVYSHILELVSKKYQFARNIAPLRTTGEREFMKVIGEEAEGIEEGATVIKKKNLVDVKIGSWLSDTPTARKRAIIELAGVLPDLDPQTILEGYEVGNIADVIKRIKERQEQRLADEKELKEAPTKEGGIQEVAAGVKEIIEGRQPTLQGPVSPEALQFIDNFLQRQEAQGLDPEVIQAIQSFKNQLAQGPVAEN